MSSIVWRWGTGPFSERVIVSTERGLGVNFPADYRECVRENGGGAPEPSGFSLALADGRRISGRASLLLSLDPREDEDVGGTVMSLTMDERLPEGLIPIISDGEGNYVCLDYRADPSRKAPTIAYLSADGAAAPLAETFTGFLELLA